MFKFYGHINTEMAKKALSSFKNNFLGLEKNSQECEKIKWNFKEIVRKLKEKIKKRKLFSKDDVAFLTPQALKKKMWFFMETHVTPPTPLIPHHSFFSKYLPLWRASSLLLTLFYFFFFILSQTHNIPLSHSLTLPPVHHSTTSTIICRQVLPEMLRKNLLSSYIPSYLR